MATTAVNKNKVSVLAKDLGMTSKEIVSIMKEYVDTVKGPSQVLDERELSILFEYMTQKNPVDIATIFADTYQEKKEEKPAPQKEGISDGCTFIMRSGQRFVKSALRMLKKPASTIRSISFSSSSRRIAASKASCEPHSFFSTVAVFTPAFSARVRA